MRRCHTCPVARPLVSHNSSDRPWSPHPSGRFRVGTVVRCSRTTKPGVVGPGQGTAGGVARAADSGEPNRTRQSMGVRRPAASSYATPPSPLTLTYPTRTESNGRGKA